MKRLPDGRVDLSIPEWWLASIEEEEHPLLTVLGGVLFFVLLFAAISLALVIR